MAKTPAKTPAPASDFKTDATHLSVSYARASAANPSFWCAGIKFSRDKTLIAKADLSDDQAKKIMASKFLAVAEVSPTIGP
ncbi:hypothetical protein [Rhodoblastus sp.]|uniref:hypothetical protein n=1 Tax=Rhodoblastus sp. TaxID=1962975 RepID=UPI003F9895B2